MSSNDADIVEFRLVGLPRVIDTDELEEFVEHTLGEGILESQYFLSNNKRTIAVLTVQTDLPLSTGARLLRTSTFNGDKFHVELPRNSRSKEGDDARASSGRGKKSKSKEWELAKEIAVSFYEYIKDDASRLERASDREQVGTLLCEYCEANDITHSHRLESRVCSMMRQKKLMKSKRYGDKVVVTFALEEPGRFSSEDDARDRVLQNMKEEKENKNGVVVSEGAIGLPNMVPVKASTDFHFEIDTSERYVELDEVTIVGPQKRAFSLHPATLLPMSISDQDQLYIRFKSTGIGLYRAAIQMHFSSRVSPNSVSQSFAIVRPVTIRSGDATMDVILKPSSPYVKREKRFEKPPKDVIPPPKAEKKDKGSNPFKLLPQHKIPGEIRELIMNRELEGELEIENPDSDVTSYAEFWKGLLWASEHQAYEDIKLYDMENARLKREGRYMVLHVPGLAEGRPSVLRGDLVNVTWKGSLYKGRVIQTRLLEVLMELDHSFHRKFSDSLDTVDVRFTFSRTTFRTCHEGSFKALQYMGENMLAPKREHVIERFPRSVPRAPQWANRSLNDEQRAAVFRILQGECRPAPYILFGPPGTGKTTTVVEAVYQLHRHDKSLNILFVAPSNDAADILVEKLSSYFPPSEMTRVIAYSRSIDQVSQVVRPYVTEGLSGEELRTEITKHRIVVSTVNLAARFVYYGVPRGHFGVLCVDEAGHATEAEVIGVAASLMDFQKQDSQTGQLILAGDPKQLGPVITSDLCQKFGMSVSYMERLTGTEVYGRDEQGKYPPGLLMKLVQTYRSHPAILKLPNEMFYDGDLLACGDVVSTHSLAKWEHLPQVGFPIIFHAVNGENLREGTSPSWFNKEEAQEVVNYVDLLVNQSRPAVLCADIGIITPYARQAQKIRQLLKHCNFPDIKVGSVETFQGQERRCIILSTVRAQSDLLSVDRKFNLGFVCNEKRFNVAVTRAKSLLIVVGSPSVLATDEKAWLPFLRYCKENNAWVGQPWEESDVETLEAEEGDSLQQQVEKGWELVDDNISQAVAQMGLGFINREE